MLQKIFFGPPGCGKSYRVRLEAESELKIVGRDNPDLIETTFHPEYSYGDFVAKLLPKTNEDGLIEYRIYAGPLIKALARAYAYPNQNVLLVIDELNRGNCAQIFGDIFQLLDRDADDWSEYGIDPSDLIMDALKQELCRLEKKLEDLPEKLKISDGKGYKLRLPPKLSLIGTMNTSDESVYYMDTAFKRRWDFEYMRWDGRDTPTLQKNAKIWNTDHTWHEFLEKLNAFIAHEFKGRNVDDKQVGIWFLKVPNLAQLKTLTERSEKLSPLLGKLKNLVSKNLQADWEPHFPNAKNYDRGGNLDTLSVKQDVKGYGVSWPGNVDKTKPEELANTLINCIGDISVPVSVVARAAIINKLMFFLWDNVFSRNHEPLQSLLKDGGSSKESPRTFGEFVSEDNVIAFIEGVMTWPKATEASGQ
jgi:hypothetical protein